MAKKIISALIAIGVLVAALAVIMVILKKLKERSTCIYADADGDGETDAILMDTDGDGEIDAVALTEELEDEAVAVAE